MVVTVPLKAVMAVLFVVIAAVAVIVAFVPTTLIGISSNEDTGKKLQRSTSDFVTQRITTLLSSPTNIYSAVKDLQISNRIDADLLTPAGAIDTVADDRSTKYMDDLKDKMNAFRSSSGTLPATALSNTSQATSTTNIVSSVFAYVPYSRRLYSSSDYFGSLEHRSVASELGLNTTIYDQNNNQVGAQFVPIPNIIDFAPSFPFLSLIVSLTDDSVHCSQSLLLTDFGGAIVCGYRYVDPRNATKDVYVGMAIPSATVSQQVSLISATDNTLITVLMSSTKEVVGLSWGEEPETRLDQFGDFTVAVGLRIRLKNVTQIEHPTIQAALAALGGPSGLDGRTYPYRFSIGSGRDEIYGDLNIYQDNSTGLSMYVLVTMPKDDFLGSIYRTTYLIAGIVCGACVLLMVVGVVFAYCLVRPLDELGERMQLTASFKDDGTHSSTPSRMSEINQLQTAFETMRDQLSTMKAYLPQSVLEALRGGDGSEDSEVDEGEAPPHEGSSIILSRSDLSSNIDSGGTTLGNRGGRQASIATTSKSASKKSSKDRQGTTNTSVVHRFTASLHEKAVTIVAFNLRNTHSTWGQLQSSVPGVQERYLSVILARCQEHRGVVDTFQGDRVIASFNAVRSCAQSGRRGAQTALDVVALCTRSNTRKSSVTAGIAYGRALVGNSGAAEMMKFNVIGPVVGEAVALERCARVATSTKAQFVRPSEAESLALGQFRNTTPVYLHSGFRPFVNELENHFALQPIDIVRRKLAGVRTSVDDSEQVVLLAPHPRSNTTSDEWMYELANNGKEAPLLQLFEWYNEIIAANLGDGVKHIQESLRARLNTLLEATTGVSLQAGDTASPSEAVIPPTEEENIPSQPVFNESSLNRSRNYHSRYNSARNSIASDTSNLLASKNVSDKPTNNGASIDCSIISSSIQLLSILDRCNNFPHDDGTAMWLCS